MELIETFTQFADGIGVAALHANYDYERGLSRWDSSKGLRWLGFSGKGITESDGSIQVWTGVSRTLPYPFRALWQLETDSIVTTPEISHQFAAEFVETTGAPDGICGVLVPATGSLLQLPLAGSGGHPIGFVVFSRTTTEVFTDRDKAIGAEVCSRLGMWIEAVQERERERAIALEVHRSLLPQSMPEIRGLKFASVYLPSKNVWLAGGDWFDVMPFSPHRVAATIGTVSGVGAKSAVAMTQVRSVLKVLAPDFKIAHVLEQANRTLPTVSIEQFATCCYVEVDGNDGTAEIGIAGHYPPVVVRGDGTSELVDISTNVALGLLDEANIDTFRAYNFSFGLGDILIMYTGGVAEHRGLSVDDILNAVVDATSGSNSADEACRRILEYRFSSNGDDKIGDLTLLAIQFTPSIEIATNDGYPKGVATSRASS